MTTSMERPASAHDLPLIETRQIGALRVHAIQAGRQRLDGGAMFGVVPKVLWQRKIAADERNRIELGMRCLLVEHADGLVLIDTGSGNKETPKFHDIYGIENAGAEGRTALEDGVRAAGFTPEDVSLVINTHLHFDHAGGNTWRDADGTIRPAFPRARYVVQRGEHGWATHPNERTVASYFPPNFAPLEAAGVLDLIDGDRVLRPGISVRRTPGHVPHHQSVVIDGGSERAIFLGDVMPTSHHVPLPWIMGYDVEPLVTLESKRALLTEAVADRWLLVFEHDAQVAWGRAAHDGKGFAFEPLG
ncbi:MAG: MBL fold metallo-hydrolase [Gemmatimonadaceae bacterium]|jgi:glyoxylase-like metal-dependent hydrolase (beta-lactamase superfamily II)|nr:MBL fold metallo-hydrolase [Gemmatimonadaceae bacterium]